MIQIAILHYIGQDLHAMIQLRLQAVFFAFRNFDRSLDPRLKKRCTIECYNFTGTSHVSLQHHVEMTYILVHIACDHQQPQTPRLPKINLFQTSITHYVQVFTQLHIHHIETKSMV